MQSLPRRSYGNGPRRWRMNRLHFRNRRGFLHGGVRFVNVIAILGMRVGPRPLDLAAESNEHRVQKLRRQQFPPTPRENRGTNG